MESAAKRPRIDPTVSTQGAVVFDVGGKSFKVMKLVIMRHPDTLLASVLGDIGSVEGEVFYVDANPERFPCILDWYRFGEMHVKSECVQALLNDARYFLLPDRVKINGRIHNLKPIAPSVEERWDQHKLDVVSKWPGFQAYINHLADQIMAKVLATEDHSALARLRPCLNVKESYKDGRGTRHDLTILNPNSGNTPNTPMRQGSHVHGMKWHGVQLSEAEDDTPGVNHGFEHTSLKNKRMKWLDLENICNAARLHIVVRELLALGFECKINCYKNDFEIFLLIGVAVRSHRTQFVSIEDVSVFLEEEDSECARGSLAIGKVFDDSKDP